MIYFLYPILPQESEEVPTYSKVHPEVVKPKASVVPKVGEK